MYTLLQQRQAGPSIPRFMGKNRLAAPTPAGWSPGHSTPGPKLGQEETPVLENPILGVAVNTLTAVGAGYLANKSEGTINTISWIVMIVAGLRAFNDIGKLGITG